MGYHVTKEVFDHSRQKGGKLLILLALAETAHNDDAVAFGLEQGWPKKERNERRKRETIAGKARLRPETVWRLIEELAGEHNDEIEVRSVQHGRVRTFVYRIVLGDYRNLEVDAERLERYQQHVDRPFSTPEELALPWRERPANFSGGRSEPPPDRSAPPPEEMSGGHERDCLTSGPRLPDIDACDDLTSAGPDASLYARATVQGPVPDSSLTFSSERSSEENVPAAAGAPAADHDRVEQLVRAFALALGRWPQDRGEWAAWKKAFRPLADAGVTGEELRERCDAYVAYWQKRGHAIDVTPFGLTKHWKAISESLERSFFAWSRWATETSWRLPVDEVEWRLEQARAAIVDGDWQDVARMAERARAAHADPTVELLRWVEAKGWSLDDDDWRLELAARLPRVGATEVRREATHRRHELRRDLARLRAGLALPPRNEEAAA